MIPFRLEHYHFTLDMFGRRRVDENTPAGGAKTRDTEDLFREELTFTGDGFIGHPNLLKLDFSATLRLEQISLDGPTIGGSERTSENLNEYNISGLLFQRSKTPITIHSRRSQVLIDRQFASSLDSVITEHGVRISSLDADFPHHLRYTHREQSQENQAGISDFNIRQDTVGWQGHLTLGPGHRLIWDYALDHVNEQGQIRPANSFNRQDGVITHTLDFGPGRRNNLRTDLRIFRESGQFPFNRLNLDESLRLHHSDSLQTQYDYSYNRQTRLGVKQTQHRGSMLFRHQLYDSLSTTGDFGASILDLPTDHFTSREIFGSLNPEYQKRVPNGMLFATTQVNWNRQKDDDRGSILQIIDEPRTFDASDIILLTRRNIILSTIVVTDSTGLIFYVDGTDYVTQAIGEDVRIRRVLGGTIAPGQTVLIDYDIGPEPGGTTTTFGLGGSVRYTLEEGPLRGLSIFARYFDQDQSRSGLNARLLTEADFHELIYGMDYALDGLILNAEWQNRESTVSSFDATRLEARYLQHSSPGSNFSLSANYYAIEYPDSNLETTITTLSARWNTQLTQKLRANLELIWRDESDTSSGDVEGLEQELNLTWKHRQTTVYASIRNAFTNSTVNDTLAQTLLLGIRREF